MPLLRASSLDQFWECSAWVGNLTPEDKKLCDDQFSAAEDAKNWGTMVHTWIQTGQFRHPWHDSDDKDMKKWATREEKLLSNRVYKFKLTPSKLYPIEGLHEVAIAYNWRLKTSIISYYGDDEIKDAWKAGFDNDWITGSCDFYLEDLRGTGSVNDLVWVDDLKTGKHWNKAPKDCKQLKFYALCLYLNAERIPKKGMQISITHWPKYPVVEPNRIPDTITEAELLEFENELVDKCYKAVGETRKYNPSEDNCRFCPGRFSCAFRVEPEEYQWKTKIK